jgi:hypothetical protein
VVVDRRTSQPRIDTNSHEFKSSGNERASRAGDGDRAIANLLQFPNIGKKVLLKAPPVAEEKIRGPLVNDVSRE